MSNIIIAALTGTLFGLLLSRKRGPFNIFRLIKEAKGLNAVFRCETCTILWLTFTIFIVQSFLGIIPNSLLLYFQLFIAMLASGGLSLVFSGIAQSVVEHDG
jgi:hypothetical protein